MGIKIVDGGVEVTSPRENGPAANAGIKAGDIITEIDDAPVKAATSIKSPTK